MISQFLDNPSSFASNLNFLDSDSWQGGCNELFTSLTQCRSKVTLNYFTNQVKNILQEYQKAPVNNNGLKPDKNRYSKYSMLILLGLGASKYMTEETTKESFVGPLLRNHIYPELIGRDPLLRTLGFYCLGNFGYAITYLDQKDAEILFNCVVDYSVNPKVDLPSRYFALEALGEFLEVLPPSISDRLVKGFGSPKRIFDSCFQLIHSTLSVNMFDVVTTIMSIAGPLIAPFGSSILSNYSKVLQRYLRNPDLDDLSPIYAAFEGIRLLTVALWKSPEDLYKLDSEIVHIMKTFATNADFSDNISLLARDYFTFLPENRIGEQHWNLYLFIIKAFQSDNQLALYYQEFLNVFIQNPKFLSEKEKYMRPLLVYTHDLLKNYQYDSWAQASCFIFDSILQHYSDQLPSEIIDSILNTTYGRYLKAGSDQFRVVLLDVILVCFHSNLKSTVQYLSQKRIFNAVCSDLIRLGPQFSVPFDKIRYIVGIMSIFKAPRDVLKPIHSLITDLFKSVVKQIESFKESRSTVVDDYDDIGAPNSPTVWQDLGDNESYETYSFEKYQELEQQGNQDEDYIGSQQVDLLDVDDSNFYTLFNRKSHQFYLAPLDISNEYAYFYGQIVQAKTCDDIIARIPQWKDRVQNMLKYCKPIYDLKTKELSNL